MKPLILRTLLLLSTPALFWGANTVSAADAASPFTREFSGSLVHWMPWGGGALSCAKEKNLPVYVFLGSFLSELSRSTETQSFTNAETAAYLNAHFVCILVDREEHPDIAAAAQQYLDRFKQTSGWPVNLFLTPDMKPFDGAAYLSPAQEWGQQSLLQVATRAAEAWKVDSKGCIRTAAASVAALCRPAPAAKAVDDMRLEAALGAGARDWTARYDGPHGGFGDAPRYLQPEVLAFLLTQGGAARTLALSALREIATGTSHDSAKGGFYRYLTDSAGNTPYLQKTLADQARMVLAFADAQQASADPAYANAIRGTLGYVLGALATHDGTFACSEDLTGDKPQRDDRSAADANGFLLAAFSRAGKALGDAGYLVDARALGKAIQLRFITQAGVSSHFADGSGIASPADYAALAAGYRALARAADDSDAGTQADSLLARCDQLFLDAKQGIYLASPAEVPAGVFSRAPAYLLSDSLPAPESLALLAGPSKETAAALERGLVQRLTVSGSATGDELLSLGPLCMPLGR
jgi:uncharacterized protein YyaL (SSP411 family)